MYDWAFFVGVDSLNSEKLYLYSKNTDVHMVDTFSKIMIVKVFDNIFRANIM